MINRLTQICNKLKYAIQSEGILRGIRRGISFLTERIFWYENYYLCSMSLENFTIDPEDHKPDIPGITYVFVTSNEQANRLVEKGFEDFRKYHFHSYHSLDSGAIANCVYVGKEMAYICWIARNEEAKKNFNDLPYRVDFQNGEACAGTSLTVPKFRRKGIRIYGALLRYRYYKENNIHTQRGIKKVSNTRSLRSSARYGDKPCGRARYIKVLGWKFWKEMPLHNPPTFQIDKKD